MIKATDIHKYYTRGSERLHVLKGVSIDIEERSFSLVHGVSGSGKSSLLNILSLLDSPDVGDISYNGITVQDTMKQGLRRTKIGFIFQLFNLIPVLSALENVVLPLRAGGKITKAHMEKASHLLEEVGLGDKIHQRPNQLSGGQQQRVAIARALVHDPEVVFADEPTANLDSTTAESIINVLLERRKTHNVAFIFSTHDDRLTPYAQKIYRLHDGVLLS